MRWMQADMSEKKRQLIICPTTEILERHPILTFTGIGLGKQAKRLWSMFEIDGTTVPEC